MGRSFLEQPAKSAAQLAQMQRFAQKVIHACAKTIGAVLAGCARSDRHDLHVQAVLLLPFADFLGGCQPIHARHLDVHQDQLVFVAGAGQRVNGLLAAGYHICLEPQVCKLYAQHFLIGGIVFHNQNVGAGNLLAHRVTLSAGADGGSYRIVQRLPHGQAKPERAVSDPHLPRPHRLVLRNYVGGVVNTQRFPYILGCVVNQARIICFARVVNLCWLESHLFETVTSAQAHPSQQTPAVPPSVVPPT